MKILIIFLIIKARAYPPGSNTTSLTFHEPNRLVNITSKEHSILLHSFLTSDGLETTEGPSFKKDYQHSMLVPGLYTLNLANPFYASSCPFQLDYFNKARLRRLDITANIMYAVNTTVSIILRFIEIPQR
jgi:hypothetical protein